MIEVREKPLITFALFAYNQEKYIREAVEGAFAQTYSPLEIILSDDCSTDGTFDLIQALAATYKGPHKIILNRNATNLGIGAHINRIVQLANGELVVAAAGDDISSPNRTSAIYKAWTADPRAMYIHSDWTPISAIPSKEGISHKRERPKPGKDSICLLAMIANCGPKLSGCTEAWHRSVFDVFGMLPADIFQEDRALPFRALLLGHLAYIDEVLVQYRIHSKSTWGALRSEYSLGFEENRRRYLVKMKQRVAIYNSFKSDLLLAKQKNLISGELAVRAQAAIDACIKITRLRIDAKSGSAVKRILSTLQLLLYEKHATRPTFRANIAALCYAVFPALEKMRYEQRR